VTLALVLVDAGEAALLARHPTREGPIREVGQLLRDWIHNAESQKSADDAPF
jgi:hypothetical protein